MALSKTKSTYDLDAIWTHADNKSAKEWKQSYIYIFFFIFFHSLFHFLSLFTIKSNFIC